MKGTEEAAEPATSVVVCRQMRPHPPGQSLLNRQPKAVPAGLQPTLVTLQAVQPNVTGEEASITPHNEKLPPGGLLCLPMNASDKTENSKQPPVPGKTYPSITSLSLIHSLSMPMDLQKGPGPYLCHEPLFSPPCLVCLYP